MDENTMKMMMGMMSNLQQQMTSTPSQPTQQWGSGPMQNNSNSKFGGGGLFD